MAEIIERRRVDDLDPDTPAEHHLTFSFGSKHYEIDLNDAHKKEMEGDFEKWAKHGRKIPAPGAPSRRAARKRGEPSIAATDKEIRQWAIGAGIDNVPDRGRIRKEILNAYAEAHS